MRPCASSALLLLPSVHIYCASLPAAHAAATAASASSAARRCPLLPVSDEGYFLYPPLLSLLLLALHHPSVLLPPAKTRLLVDQETATDGAMVIRAEEAVVRPWVVRGVQAVLRLVRKRHAGSCCQARRASCCSACRPLKPGCPCAARRLRRQRSEEKGQGRLGWQRRRWHRQRAVECW